MARSLLEIHSIFFKYVKYVKTFSELAQLHFQPTFTFPEVRGARTQSHKYNLVEQKSGSNVLLIEANRFEELSSKELIS
jgi:hypothetical protein